MTTRRDGLRVAGLALAVALVLPLPGAARAEVTEARPEEAAALAKEGPLGDVWLGAKDAKVTVIEYASMTCGHCAAFHNEGFKHLKERYVDTGKVRFVLREYPLDALATAAFMLARCEGNEKYYPVTGLLFETQSEWAFAPKPVDALQATVAKAGIGKDRFEACLKDQRLFDGVTGVLRIAHDALKVDSTPTLFINGARNKGGMLPADLDKVLKPLLGE